MINYSVFKGARLLCNSYLKWEIRKGLNETFFDISHLHYLQCKRKITHLLQKVQI